MRELSFDSSAAAVAQRYSDLIDAWVVDKVDEDTLVPSNIKKVLTSTMMVSMEDRERLARDVLDATQQMSSKQLSTTKTVDVSA